MLCWIEESVIGSLFSFLQCVLVSDASGGKNFRCKDAVNAIWDEPMAREKSKLTLRTR